jgi:MFS family permease
MNTNFANTHL